MSEEISYNSIEDMLNNLPKNFKILEEVIDLEIQRDFYEATKKLKSKLKNDSITKFIQQLADAETELKDQKKALVKLCTVDSVEAYRALEKFQENAIGEIRTWSILAFQQSRMVMHSSFLEEQTVYISTGLGGKDQMLRYFIVFPFNQEQGITEFQKDILEKELDFNLETKKGIIEEIAVYQHYATAKALIPITAPVSEIFGNIIEECNQYNAFLNPNLIITNTKILLDSEIVQLIQNNEK